MARWTLVAPACELGALDGVLEVPVAFAGGTTLGPCPEWVRSTDKELVSIPHRDALARSRLAFCHEYEASEPDASLRAQEFVAKAGVSLWLSGEFPAGAALLAHFDEQRNLRAVESGESIMLSGGVDALRLDASSLAESQLLHSSLVRQATLTVPTLMLYRALIDRWWQTRFVSLWVVLEALFGPKDSQEVTYRISARMTRFLCSGGGDELLCQQKRIKGLYSWRSKVVHGHRLGSLASDEANALMSETEGLIRQSYKRIISRGLTEVFGSNDRDVFLDRLLLHGN